MNDFREEWRIHYWSQVLYNGSWDSDDCEWEWECRTETFPTETSARTAFNKCKSTNDIPVIRLMKALVDTEYDSDVYEDVVEEIS